MCVCVCVCVRARLFVCVCLRKALRRRFALQAWGITSADLAFELLVLVWCRV